MTDPTATLRSIVLRFAREYHADDPGAMTQDVMEHYAAAIQPLVGDVSMSTEAIDALPHDAPALMEIARARHPEPPDA
jgi:hypothetical protein